jgi:hypothetical protein
LGLKGGLAMRMFLTILMSIPILKGGLAMRMFLTILMSIPILICINAIGIIPNSADWYVHICTGFCVAMISDAWVRDFYR